MSESEALTSLVCLDIVTNYHDWTLEDRCYGCEIRPTNWNSKLPLVKARKGDIFYCECKIGNIPITSGQFRRIFNLYKKQYDVIERKALSKEFDKTVDFLLERRK